MELAVHPEVRPLIPKAPAHTRSACRDMRGAPVQRWAGASADETWCALDYAQPVADARPDSVSHTEVRATSHHSHDCLVRTITSEVSRPHPSLTDLYDWRRSLYR